jgi:uncharacterized protein
MNMKTTVRWCDWKGNGLEHCCLRQSADGLHLEGIVAGTRESLYGAHYAVRTDENFRTREVHVTYVDGPSLHILADGKGNWHDVIADASLPSLEGCLDVDIGVTPATNTLPIKRLGLNEAESQNISAAYVPLFSQISGPFLPRRADQRYTCLTLNRLYRYEGIFRAFSADLEVDEFGLVWDYSETFRRIAPI